MLVGRFVKRASGRGGALVRSSTRRAAFLQSISKEAVPFSRELLLKRLQQLAELAEKWELGRGERGEVDSILDEEIWLYDVIWTGMSGVETKVEVRTEEPVRLKLPPVARLLDLPSEVVLTNLMLLHDWISNNEIHLLGYYKNRLGIVEGKVKVSLFNKTPLRDLLKFLVILSAAERAGLKVMDEFLNGLRKENEKLARYLEKAWGVAAVFELME